MKPPGLDNFLNGILKSDQELSSDLVACNANGKNCVDVTPQYLHHFGGFSGGSNGTSSDFPSNMNLIDTDIDGDDFSGEYHDGYSDLPAGYYEDFGFSSSVLPSDCSVSSRYPHTI